MGGWAARSLTVAPNGTAMPCPTAGVITSLSFPDVREHSLADIWQTSDAFLRYRGTDWLPAPCSTCEHREDDYGGCRCQAFALLGDAGRTDPVCSLSPDRPVVDALLAAGSGAGAEQPLTLRRYGSR
jgi:pyrroloquinoline quinone biosynthesis protein E